MFKNLITAVALLTLSGCAHSDEGQLDEASPNQSLINAIEENRSVVDFDGQTFSGSGWGKLIAEGKEADFFLIGEEHGISENPKLVAQLFKALEPSGYRRFGIEVSPFMARRLDDAVLSAGLQGLAQLFSEPSGEPAFFGMKEEAEMLASIRAALQDEDQVFWGLDYEVIGDRQMIVALEKMPKPDQAVVALDALKSAVNAAWQKYEETRGPQFIFSFSGDPELVRTVKNAWPQRPATADGILNTLEETLEINRLFVSGQNWSSNHRRANLIRSNFVNYLRKSDSADPSSDYRVMFKMGASHLIRGRNSNGVFDLGTLVPELAETRNKHSFSLLILPGPEAEVAVLDPTQLEYVNAAPRGGYSNGLELIVSAAHECGYTLFDMRPLRAEVESSSVLANDRLRKVVFGFDMVLVMVGSTPSKNF